VLFDQGTPVPLRSQLSSHKISTVYELGWGSLQNGKLLQQAESQGFEVLVTTDQNLKYQKNLASRRIAIGLLAKSIGIRPKQSLQPTQHATCCHLRVGANEVPPQPADAAGDSVGKNIASRLAADPRAC
jgi:hypothetical protein